MATKGSGAGAESAQQKESSVLFSLQELMSLEKSRVEEEEQHRRRQVEAATQARLEAERRDRAAQEQRLREEEERRREVELRRRLDEAQIEAAKHAEIEKRRLEEQHRLQMEATAQQQAHERQLQHIQAQKRRGAHPALLAGIGVALLGALIAVVFFVWVKPIGDAKVAVEAARTRSSSIARSDWEEGLKLVAIAKDKDPSNKDLPAVEADLRQRIADDDAAKAVKAAALADDKRKADEKIAELTEKLRHTTDPKEAASLRDQIASANGRGPGVGATPAVQAAQQRPKKNCPPPRAGVPLDAECK